ncbi:enoyl-CoA hydratase/isomerase family protein [Natrarchaeobius sp. A-rgal3]|uniref:enoyl-CoA hydratase/isomerase family protein n=1 Tax=Natrarchaeobius versutus TaxID=1679078 RepID=UPI00350F1377
MRTELETAIVEFDDETGIATLTLNRPEALNTLNGQLLEDIVEGLRLLEEQNDEVDGVALRAVIIEGAGEKAFCAGADVGGFSDSAGETSSRSALEFLHEFPTPVIAKIQGYCLGGGLETAFACDFRFASEDSTFGLPEVTLGLLPGAGGVQYATHIAGPAVAKELAMTGDHFEASWMAENGLINGVYAADELDDEVEAFAENLASNAPLAIQSIKKSVDIAQHAGLREGIEFDRNAFGTLLNTDDAKEGGAAFAEDREPEFEGK